MAPPLRTLSSFLVTLAFVAGVTAMPGLPAQAVSDDTEVVFDGSGWGHGVGMSQYGAYGLALNGRGPAQIVKHYYQGTRVRDASNTSAAPWISSTKRPLWIGLMQNRKGINFTLIGGGATLCQSGDGRGCPKYVRPQAGETWRFFLISPGVCAFKRVDGGTVKQLALGSCTATLKPNPGTTIRMNNEGIEYSSGIFRFRAVPSNPSKFHVALQIGVDDYLRGIAEMPTSWPLPALKAQVIAARSYLMSNTAAKGPQYGFSTAVKDSCWCHLYDDTRSQVYRGDILLESRRWQRAVSETSGRVIAYQGSLVRAFYSSSSGGKTENVEDVWGGSGAPWLVSVNDDWAHIPEVNNPRSNWRFTFTAGEIANRVGLSRLDKVEITRNESGSVATVKFIGRLNGSATTVTRSGSEVRSAFGLYSNYFRVGIDSETQDTDSAPFGWIDEVSVNGGVLTTKGWAIDADAPDEPVGIHVYVNGNFFTGGPASLNRPDVDQEYGMGPNHGFAFEKEIASGSHQVCIYALNIPSHTNNTLLGCRSVG